MVFKSLGIQSYSQMMIEVSNHLLSIIFRFHCHSQKVIGSLGNGMFVGFFKTKRYTSYKVGPKSAVLGRGPNNSTYFGVEITPVKPIYFRPFIGVK